MHPTGKYEKLEPVALRDFDWCQTTFVVIMALILLYLIGFIIYISETWDKNRINEYS